MMEKARGARQRDEGRGTYGVKDCKEKRRQGRKGDNGKKDRGVEKNMMREQKRLYGRKRRNALL